MKLLKWVAAISGILAGLAGFNLLLEKKKAEEERLNNYLVGSHTNPKKGEKEKPSIQIMVEDIYSWQHAAAQNLPVSISFGFTNAQDAEKFQEMAALNGYSSTIDSKNFVVDVEYSSALDLESLSHLAEVLAEACDLYHANYQGFSFNK